MNIISFNSDEKNFDPEYNGLKRNTVRFIDDWTKERLKLYRKADTVKITNNQTTEWFTRNITHKCLYKNIAIISW